MVKVKKTPAAENMDISNNSERWGEIVDREEDGKFNGEGRKRAIGVFKVIEGRTKGSPEGIQLDLKFEGVTEICDVMTPQQLVTQKNTIPGTGFTTCHEKWFTKNA